MVQFIRKSVEFLTNLAVGGGFVMGFILVALANLPFVPLYILYPFASVAGGGIWYYALRPVVREACRFPVWGLNKLWKGCKYVWLGAYINVWRFYGWIRTFAFGKRVLAGLKKTKNAIMAYAFLNYFAIAGALFAGCGLGVFWAVRARRKYATAVKQQGPLILECIDTGKEPESKDVEIPAFLDIIRRLALGCVAYASFAGAVVGVCDNRVLRDVCELVRLMFCFLAGKFGLMKCIEGRKCCPLRNCNVPVLRNLSLCVCDCHATPLDSTGVPLPTADAETFIAAFKEKMTKEMFVTQVATNVQNMVDAQGLVQQIDILQLQESVLHAVGNDADADLLPVGAVLDPILDKKSRRLIAEEDDDLDADDHPVRELGALIVIKDKVMSICKSLVFSLRNQWRDRGALKAFAFALGFFAGGALFFYWARIVNWVEWKKRGDRARAAIKKALDEVKKATNDSEIIKILTRNSGDYTLVVLESSAVASNYDDTRMIYTYVKTINTDPEGKVNKSEVTTASSTQGTVKVEVVKLEPLPALESAALCLETKSRRRPAVWDHKSSTSSTSTLFDRERELNDHADDQDDDFYQTVDDYRQQVKEEREREMREMYDRYGSDGEATLLEEYAKEDKYYGWNKESNISHVPVKASEYYNPFAPLSSLESKGKPFIAFTCPICKGKGHVISQCLKNTRVNNTYLWQFASKARFTNSTPEQMKGVYVHEVDHGYVFNSEHVRLNFKTKALEAKGVQSRINGCPIVDVSLLDKMVVPIFDANHSFLHTSVPIGNYLVSAYHGHDATGRYYQDNDGVFKKLVVAQLAENVPWISVIDDLIFYQKPGDFTSVQMLKDDIPAGTYCYLVAFLDGRLVKSGPTPVGKLIPAEGRADVIYHFNSSSHGCSGGALVECNTNKVIGVHLGCDGSRQNYGVRLHPKFDALLSKAWFKSAGKAAAAASSN